MQHNLSQKKFFFYILLIVFTAFFNSSCGGGGGGGSTPGDSGNGVGGNDGDIVWVDPIFVRTGIVSSTVIDLDYRSVVYAGRYVYQQSESEEDLSFNPSKNFLKNLVVDE